MKKLMNTGLLSHLLMVREAKQDRNLRFLDFFQPQPQPRVFSTSNDSKHLLTISCKSYKICIHISICFRSDFDVSKHLPSASPQIIYIYIQYLLLIGHLPANHLPSANLPNLPRLPRCPIAITDIPQNAFQLSKVYGCHAIAIVGLFWYNACFLCFFSAKGCAERWVLGESKGWVLLWKLVGNQSQFVAKLLK